MSGKCLEDLISYLYSGKLGISASNATDLCAAAERLGIPAAAELCRNFIADVEKQSDNESVIRPPPDSDDLVCDVYGAGNLRSDNLEYCGSVRVSFMVSS